MFEHKILLNLDEYFLNLSDRREKNVFFYRINGYSDAIKAFVEEFYEAARLSGVVIEGKIPNPDEQNLSYYSEIMGMNFQLSLGFITSSLNKWLPRMSSYQCNNVSMAVYDTLDSMRQDGKTENILKNAYIKFMCWLYYKFERIVNQLGCDKTPKILYEGNISNYELKLLTILSKAGCDVILLQYEGDNSYLSLDNESIYSISYPEKGLSAFPENYSIKAIRQNIEDKIKMQRIYGELPQIMNCTNAWIEGKGLEDVLKGGQERGNDLKLFYNCFYRINGVEDELTYLNELYQFYLQLKNMRRKVVIVNHDISKPTIEEIANIRRNNYSKFEHMASDLASNIEFTASIELQKMMRKVFIDVLIEVHEKPENSLNKITNKAIYMLCWLNRYKSQLFSNWKNSEISCFIYLGGCRNESEAMFIQLLSKLPIDVVILVPNLNIKCYLEDRVLYDLNYPNSMEVEKFPCDYYEIKMGTVAYHAEKELDTIMYQGSGIYRNQQCSKAMTIVLKTMYEEISILWDQDLKYRPNFSTVDGVVNIPVIFAKVSGIKDGAVQKYWSEIKNLVTENTYLIKNVPFLKAIDPNPIRLYATEFLKNGKIQKNKIKAHKAYQYKVLRDEMQNHLLDKLQLLLDQRSLKGTFENGTEYTIISVALNINKELVRLIQKFDFTKKNPKLLYINATETMISLEDSIITAFLSLVGFDIIFFVPTGYQTVENYFNTKILEEHQTGEYIYDLAPPDFDTISLYNRQSWRDKIFKRGN